MLVPCNEVVSMVVVTAEVEEEILLAKTFKLGCKVHFAPPMILVDFSRLPCCSYPTLDIYLIFQFLLSSKIQHFDHCLNY